MLVSDNDSHDENVEILQYPPTGTNKLRLAKPALKSPDLVGKSKSGPQGKKIGAGPSLLRTVFEELDEVKKRREKELKKLSKRSSFDVQMDFSAFEIEDIPWYVKRIPMLDWLPKYTKKTFKNDLIAGLSVGLMMVPQAIAHAAIAGVSPILGLYTGFIGGMMYPTFASCRHLAVGTGAVVALLAGGELDILESTYPNLDRDQGAVFLCFFVGMWQIALGVFGLGYIQSFLSSPVMNGSLCGAAFIIMSTQLKHLIGVSYDRSQYFFVTVYNFFSHLGEAKWAPILISIVSVILLMMLRNFKRELKAGKTYMAVTPGTCLASVILLCSDFSAVVVSILGLIGGYAASSADREDLVPMVGSLPDGLLAISNPLDFGEVSLTDLIIPSFIMGLISFVLAIALAKKLGSMFNYHVDASQELIALGIAGVVGSFFSCFPMQSSLSRTMVNVQAGAFSSVAGWIAGLMVFMGILLLKDYIYYLPKSSLAAIIEIAALKLVDFELPQWLYHMHVNWGDKLRSDWAVWMGAFLTTLGVGVVYGITLGLVLSCLLLIERSTKPKYAILGRLPDTNTYRSVDNFPEALMFQSVIVVRFDASLHFANSGYFRDLLHQIERSVAKIFSKQSGEERKTRRNLSLKGLVVDMGSVNEVDATGIQVLKEMCLDYKNKGIILILANMKGTVRSVAQRSHLSDFLHQEDLLIEVHEAVQLCEPEVKTEEKGGGEPPVFGDLGELPDMQLKRSESALDITHGNVQSTIFRALHRQSPLVQNRRKTIAYSPRAKIGDKRMEFPRRKSESSFKLASSISQEDLLELQHSWSLKNETDAVDMTDLTTQI